MVYKMSYIWCGQSWCIPWRFDSLLVIFTRYQHDSLLWFYNTNPWLVHSDLSCFDELLSRRPRYRSGYGSGLVAVFPLLLDPVVKNLPFNLANAKPTAFTRNLANHITLSGKTRIKFKYDFCHSYNINRDSRWKN